VIIELTSFFFTKASGRFTFKVPAFSSKALKKMSACDSWLTKLHFTFFPNINSGVAAFTVFDLSDTIVSPWQKVPFIFPKKNKESFLNHLILHI
jgi:hypothetical protein